MNREIKDGTISGFLPNTEAFAVHYPGYPSSMSRAIETLGGTEGIHKAHNSQSNRLELRFRPEDPYSHPAYGDLRPCNSLLLKISKNKSSSNGQSCEVSNRTSLPDETNIGDKELSSNPENGLVTSSKEDARISEDNPTNLCADIVARILEAYHFDGMVDYQHVIGVHADVSRRKKRSWMEMEEPHFKKGGLLDGDQEDVMILVPPIFSPKDVPENLVLRPSVILSSKKNQEGLVQPEWEMDMEPVLAIDFNIKEVPKRINWEEYIPQGSEQWELQMAVSKLFDEKPIWPKDSLTERLLDKGHNFAGHMLRRLLSRVAYYFSSGPFLRFWIRKGYDPRKDSNSQMYQRIDFRVHPSIRSYCDANAANQMKHRWDDICAFRVFPFKCQTSLQLFELVDDYIQQEIRKPQNQTTCTFATGWFSNLRLDNLRHRVALRFLSVYPKPGAEHLLKAATESFEKSKKRCNRDNTKLCEEEHQQAYAGQEDVEEPNNGEDDEEDDVEVDDAEEATNAYEALHQAKDGEISLQSDSYLNVESISRVHLQELFGSFPSTEPGGDRTQEADISDEEYEIFEQDSDGEFSNEDDDY
ncbi:uncharacterized protein LOC107434631 isoform X1 [Ziziphus jujuba]|uniref:Uncharacterized protein LOC107434631 isoform X1 n=2 Tax=Ziziphus jujuba TaxID=326968 RepID=A0A6P4BQX3_ZIZJJ|nr:uncharacterized protein LOC107434631 isoform X1 [Ziziphus jujuba]XP_048337135.1 uncharacterized protein LOC107434631 isoform X1 [Ziziphus jujuba]XP_048337136.1 uncharacterized protein LOC107434631 isoform X1 [Ziziphus jujuba]XP_048337137.1 uncharacterized protein LOC107434631 isoform X1 [Ziziphus jujuba]